MWVQSVDPLNNIGLSALLATFPILTLFFSLAVIKVKGYQAGLLAVGVAFCLAVIAFNMPVNLAFLSVVYGAMNGLFPIGWIVLAAVFLYNLSVKTGGFTIVKDAISTITSDRRIQALLIAFCFGAFLEGAAGFGAPVAITAGMLVGLGFNPLYAASLCLISNTAPVAFGGIGIAILTAGKVSGIDPMLISRMVAHQLPLLSFLVPFWLIAIMSGWKGVKEVLPAILTVSISYSLTMFLVASYVGPLLPDILSATVSILCLVVLLRYWKPATIWRFPGEPEVALEAKRYSVPELARAWLPFVFLVVFVADWGIGPIKTVLDGAAVKFTIPGLDKAILIAGKPLAVTYSFAWLSAAGTAILFAALLAAIVLRIRFKTVAETFWETLVELRYPLLTIAAVLGFAYVANYSGLTGALGKALTLTGSFFPFLAPFLGWLGVFITGSDTSSNALFSGAQKLTAQQIGVNPVLTVAANSTGGVAAKMISPQSIAVAAAAVGLVGQEGTLFRMTVKHSLAFVVIIGIITYLQAYYLKSMVPAFAEGATAVAAGGMSTAAWTAVIGSLAVILATAVISQKKSK